MSRSPAKRFVDVEMAVRWAYRDELPKRDSERIIRARAGTNERVWSPYTYPAGYPETSPSFREATGGGPSGGYADGWDRDPGFPMVVGGPNRDAIAIEAAVESLEGLRGHGFGAEDPAGLMWGIEHMAIDHVAAGSEAVASMAGIVAVHARAGTRPKWSRELPEPLPDRGPNGKPKVLIEAEVENPKSGILYLTPIPSPPVRAGVYRVGAYCPLVYRPAPARIVAERAEWGAWRMGLELVYESLTGKLESIALLSPAAPWCPWAGEGEAHGRPPDLFRGLREEPYRRETREQAALRRRAAKRRAERDIRAEETRPVQRGQVSRGTKSSGGRPI